MKLSLSWIFDHILGSWKDLDIQHLVQKFNTTTAEIEHYKKVTIDFHYFFLVSIIELRHDAAIAFCEELAQEIKLPLHESIKIGSLYLIKKNGSSYQWATMADFNAEKEGLLPPFSCLPELASGGWKEKMESEDYILEIDNKSITHRPDLWGHRGIAREIAAILEMPLRSEEFFLKKMPIKKDEYFFSGNSDNPFSIEIQSREGCSRFAGLYISEAANDASSLWIAHRLARIDARPIRALVDITNYVMFDIGQPMHAFDADTIDSMMIAPAQARFGQTVQLLDGDTVHLTDEDIVISNGKEPIALAGIMGGLATAVSDKTKSLFVESACFDATAIRKAALRCKKRTEASARFEKSLDPHQNITALFRFLKIAEDEQISLKPAQHVVSLGHEPGSPSIEVSHAFIESRLGIAISADFITKILQALEFVVKLLTKEGKPYYIIQVPSFRATKDIKIPEDIVEEVARFFGYENIPFCLPLMQLKSSQEDWVYKRRLIVNTVAYAMRAHEVQNYAIYDEEFLRTLGWEPAQRITIKNPISQHWQSMVTSLIPHLLKNVSHNAAEHEIIRLFEWNKIWQLHENILTEKASLAGIFFRKGSVDFYQEKSTMTILFDALRLSVSWEKDTQNKDPWYHPYETAVLYSQEKHLGFAGKINPAFLMPIADGDAFIFELDGDVLLSIVPEAKVFEPLPKYPDSSLDVSMFIPLQVTVAQIGDIIKHADGRIYQVELIDFFQKDEWIDKRSVTMRFHARDREKTLTKEDIEHIYNHVTIALQKVNAVIR
jgi:phenylalanyl-tRNA synthetase beta chain